VAQTRGNTGQRVSVVINTYNRGPSLRNTLHALRYQTHEDFEVIVVNGPSTDETAQVLVEFAADVRVASCPEVHLCKSRNIGVAEAAGDIVAFIDDDALAEPTWLQELVAAYDSETVGGAGGVVYDHTGFAFQYRYSVCDRLGHTRFDVRPPFAKYLVPGADPFIYLQGTNASFRRDCLVEIGGFDEEIEYYMDEVDVCRRVIDRGHELRPLDGAAVHHKYLASHRRNNKKVVLDPFPNVKNHCYLAVLNNQATMPLAELKAVLRKFADGVKSVAWTYHAEGNLTDAQRDRFFYQVERGLEVGIEKGLKNQRLHRQFPPADPARFKPFGTLQPPEGRKRICFVSQEYPPGDFGGIGRFTADLATGFAARGHEVHVVTRSPDTNRIDFEEGVWMHRLAAPERYLPELEHVHLGGNLFHSAAIYHEVRRIHGQRPLDVISAPLWSCEGLVCALDRERFPTVVTLMTSMSTIAALHPSWDGADWVRQVIALEQATARTARYLHPISQAILDKVRGDYGSTDAWAEVQPLGVRDRHDQYPPQRDEDDGKVRVLFVGRLERRKGVDVLLQAAVRLLERFPQAEFVLAGKDTPNTETGSTYRAQFQEKYGQDPRIASRVTFAGAVSEDQLYQHYADADIVCMPSRYESFGLVLVEGMVFGKPVVGCAVGGMCEIVETEGNGLLAQPGSAASLEECLARLLGNADLRRRFGQRSRALYEEKFALPLVVENTARFYAGIAARHVTERAAAPLAPAGTELLTERLAEVIAGATDLSAASAAAAASGLLDPTCYPVDYLAVVRRLWNEPNEAFLSGLYNLLLNRDVDHEGRAHYLASLQRGTPREVIVRHLALSAEARQAGRPVGWLKALERGPWKRPLWRRALGLIRRLAHKVFPRQAPPVQRAAGPQAHAVAPEAPPSPLARVGRKLRSLASLRNMVRYLKRAVMMPWNFQRVHENTTNLFEVARQQLESQWEMQRVVVESLGRFLREVQERQAILEQRTSETLRALTEEFRAAAREMHHELRQVKNRYAEFYGALVEGQREQTERTAELTRFIEDLRSGQAVRPPVAERRQGEPPPPQILNLELYKARLGRMGEAIRVHLGGGERPLPDYINVGAYSAPEVDVVADAEKLPFEPGSVKEIASTNLVDRFPTDHFAEVVLPYWKGLLRPGGSLRIVCPNWQALVSRLCRGELGADRFLQAVSAGMGGSAAPAAFYTARALSELLWQHGFYHVEVIAEARPGQPCPEMELLASLPAEGAQTPLLSAG
jgi:glycosyltransferase involved in cell wall biosynthesis/GT2 family glycosyltransferase